MNTAESQYSYDLVPYESHSFPQSHPDRLATLASLFGVTPVPVQHCRVLELACASGGNLIPMAFHLPDSEFVGIDLSEKQTHQARQVIQELKLDNIRIEHADMMDIDNSWGKFDYIIAHGVFSWVPDFVQDKILAIASENLSGNGLAYISYNTYPGWHIREMVRRMMLYHTAQFQETTQRIEQARALLDFLAGSVPATNNYFGKLLSSELNSIQRATDSYLFHEHLEENNSPAYFHEFMARAEKHHLQYLAEADFSTMLASGFPESVAQTLERISKDVVDAEQYMDFLRNRPFRQTILCRDDLPLTRTLTAESLEHVRISSHAMPERLPVDLDPEVTHIFRTKTNEWVQSDLPATKAALALLCENWPHSFPFDELIRKTNLRLEGNYPEHRIKEPKGKESLAEDLLRCYAGNLISLHTRQADYVTILSEAPTACPLAGYQVGKGLPIVNRRHETLNLDPVSKELLLLLDGRKKRGAFIDHLTQKAKGNHFILKKNGAVLSSDRDIRQALEATLDESLKNMAQLALLVSAL